MIPEALDRARRRAQAAVEEQARRNEVRVYKPRPVRKAHARKRVRFDRPLPHEVRQ